MPKLWDGTRIHGAYVGAITRMVTHQCGNCGALFALDAELDAQRQDDHRTFWCAGCGATFHYFGESERERLRRELRESEARAAREAARLSATRELLRHEERSHAATRGAMTKKKKEIARLREYVGAGTCPVPDCRRHFRDLGRHMASKHPGFRSAK